jgi:hypothetical protein
MARNRIQPGDELRSVEERPIGVSVPVPISWRLDQLVELAESTGARVFRKDLVAALVLASTEDPDELSRLVGDYRTATAAEAAVGSGSVAEVLELRPAKPGRRRKR